MPSFHVPLMRLILSMLLASVLSAPVAAGAPARPPVSLPLDLGTTAVSSPDFLHDSMSSLTLSQIEDAAPSAARPPASPIDEINVGPLHLRMLGGAWFPRLHGFTTLDGGSASDDLRLGRELSLDDSTATANIEVAVRKLDRWELRLSGFDFGVDDEFTFQRRNDSGAVDFGSLRLDDGDQLRTSVDITSVAAEFSVAMLYPFGIGEPDRNVDFRIAPSLSLRWADVDQTMAIAGEGRVDADGEWIGILPGLNADFSWWPEERFPWLERLSLDAAANVGPALGGDGGWMWSVRGGVGLHFTENLGLLIGYRLVDLDVEDDDYSFDGGLQGLFIAGSLRF